MNPPIELQDLGWDRRWESQFEGHALRRLIPARVLSEERGRYLVASAEAEGFAVVSGRFRNGAQSADEFPAVGDWVLLELPAGSDAIIQAVLPRRSRFARAARGDVPGAQVAAANVDLVLVVAALDHDFNLSRLERYLALAWSSGAEPAILLNKADLRPDMGEALGLVRSVAPGVPVYPLSAREGSGLDPVRALLEPGRTLALLGSSGVGKSTIVNALLGWERQAVREVREGDSRGRHSTTVRELIRLPSGALLIDSPGMRSVGMWEAEEGLASAFADVDALAGQCRFSDCSHGTEPGCAVQAAIASGSLAAQRLHSRQKLERELAAIEKRRSPDRAELRRNGRRMTKFVRNHMRTKYGDDAA